MKPALALCFFVSGATSLVLEVAWAKELSYLLGNTLYAISTVVAAFMAGLAFGSWLASRYLRDLRHSLRSYALLQCAIALCGYFSIPVLRGAAGIFEPLYGEFAGHPVAFLTARFAVVLALMSVPVTLMGMTLPVVVGGFRREPGPYARATGLLYGVNTLGAVTGTLTAGFALIPALGLAVTCASVGLVDAAVGVIAFCLHRATSRSDGGVDRVSAAPTAPAAAMLGPRARAVSLLYFGSGLVAIALEVTWFRYLVYVFGPTADAFSVMLGIYLAGVGLGSVLGARLVAPSGSSVERVALLQIVVAALVLLATLAYNDLPSWYMGLYWKLPSGDADLSAALAQAATGAFVVLPATLAMGALFPSVVRCFAGVARQPVAAERGVGLLYAQNTCGGILGSLLAGFWLLPGFGLWNALLAASATSLLIGIGFLLLSSARASRKAAIAAGALAVVFALGFGSPKPDLLALNRGLNLVFFNDPEFDASAVAQYEADRRLLFYREGVNASVAITANDGGDGALALRVSGKPVASTGLVARTHLEMLGQLPVLFARSPRRVAVVGFGAGVTAGAVLASPLVEALDVVELEPAVIEASRYFAQSNGDPLADDRTRIVVEDGRTFLRYTSRKYDVITADPISPVAAGAANLYTTGFYEVASRRLAEGGVFCQWLETWIPSEPTYRGMLASVAEVFPFVALFRGHGETVVLAAHGPIRIPWHVFEARFGLESARRRFAEIGIASPAALLSHFLAGDESIRAYVGGAAELNTDDRNWLERRMASDLRRRAKEDLDGELLRRFRLERLVELQDLVTDLPMEEIARLAARPGSQALGAPTKWLRDELDDYYAARGDQAMRARMKAWQREGERLDEPPVTWATYGDVVAAARDALRAGRRKEAERALLRLVEHPELPPYYRSGLTLAKLYADRRRPRQALDWARRLQGRSPGLVPAFAFEARIHAARGDDERVQEVVERGLFFNPGDPVLMALRVGKDVPKKRARDPAEATRGR